MSATDAQIAKLRRMTAEPTQDTYDDATLAEYIEARPCRDAQGFSPFERLLDGRLSTVANSLWTPTYDLAAAAADVWDEKASALTEETDASIDGAALTRSQAYEHAKAEARKWHGREHVGTIHLTTEPRPPLYAIDGSGVLPDPEFPAPEGEL
jgi:hypothetical protein